MFCGACEWGLIRKGPQNLSLLVWNRPPNNSYILYEPAACFCWLDAFWRCCRSCTFFPLPPHYLDTSLLFPGRHSLQAGFDMLKVGWAESMLAVYYTWHWAGVMTCSVALKTSVLFLSSLPALPFSRYMEVSCKKTQSKMKQCSAAVSQNAHYHCKLFGARTVSSSLVGSSMVLLHCN